MGGCSVEQSRLHAEFMCRCQGGAHCDTMEEEILEDPRVIIDRCGCVFRKSHLEADLRSQLSTNILTWFSRGGKVNRFSCRNRDFIIGETYTVIDVIIDPSNRYRDIWERSLKEPDCDSFATLTMREDLNNRQFALVPERLGAVLKEIFDEQRKTQWDGKTWSEFSGVLRTLRERYHRGENLGEDFAKKREYESLSRHTLHEWETRKNEAIRDRRLAFDQASWGLFQRMTFTARCIYHGFVAFIFEYGLWLLRQGNFISPMRQQGMRDDNVGDRLAILLLERNGIGYNLQERPLNTVEYRLWNYVTTR